MEAYFLALVTLSLGAVIEQRCSTPGLRPDAAPASRAFRILGWSATFFWFVLVLWGFVYFHWSQPVAGVIFCLAINGLVVRAGAHPWWPGMSMGLSLVGLFLAAVVMNK
jgi:hypothetical protein